MSGGSSCARWALAQRPVSVLHASYSAKYIGQCSRAVLSEAEAVTASMDFPFLGLQWPACTACDGRVFAADARPCPASVFRPLAHLMG